MKRRSYKISMAILMTASLLLTSCNKEASKPPENSSQTGTQNGKAANGNSSNSPGGTVKPGKTGQISIPGDFKGKAVSNTGKIDTLKALNIDRSKLINIGRILGGTPGGNTNTPSQLALTPKDIGMPVLRDIGFGYDVFDNYASAKYVKQGQILDLDRLIKDGKVFRKDMPESVYKEISSENARSYSSRVASSISLSGSYLYFSGSVKTNFSKEHIEAGKNYFSTIFYNIGLYELYIDPATDLSKYLKQDALNILETKDAQFIFANYGTHVIRSLQAGGRFDYNTSIDEKYVKDVESFSTSVKASFNAVFASANVSVSTSSTQTTEEFTKNSDIRLFTYGGDGIDGQSMKVDANSLKNWMTSVQKNPSISDFGANALIPIWDFCKTPARKEYLKKEYDKYAASKLTIVPADMAINGLRLNTVSKTDPILNQFEDESGVWYYVSNISAHSTKPGDGFTLLYCRYGREDDADNPPIVDIILEDSTEGDSALVYFNSKYVGDNTAKLWGYCTTNNIENSNLGNTINQPGARQAGAHDIKLLYVTSMKGKPIKSLILRHVSMNNNTYYFPNAPEQGKVYESILDRTEQKKGKIVPQNIGEGGVPLFADLKGSYLVYVNHYLEFSRN